MPSSPATAQSDLTSIAISVGGSAISDTYQVSHIEINKAANKISSARVVLIDGDAAGEDFSITDSATFAPGGAIDIQLGYHGTTQSVFQGIIVQQTIQKSPGASSTLTVECRDKAVAMTIGRKNAYYTKTTDSDVISKIIGSYGLSSSVASTSPQLDELIQYYATDWDFILTRAELNGLVVLVDAGKVTLAKPDLSQSAALSVTYGADIYEFSLDMDSRTQVADITCSSWDMKTQAVLTAQAKASNFNSLGNTPSPTLAKVTGSSGYNLQSTAALPQNVLSAWAQGEMIKSEMAKIRGTVLFQGSAALNPGGILEISGVGKRFSGNAYVGSVRHFIDDGSWRTEAGIGLSPIPFSANTDIVAPPAAGTVPGIQGLQNGTVKQIQEDPDGQYRVLVQIPLITTGSDGVWARLAGFYATNTAGAFFFPEVGDEVVLGFLNQDPAYPVILGSLYSSSNKVPPFTPDQPNTNKAIVTKNQLKFLFDDVKKIITIITPNKNQIVLSDEGQSITIQDQSSNKIVLSTSGILIKGSKITLEADQGIQMSTSAGDIKMSASAGEINGASLNISLSADAQLTAKANAAASFQASGQTTIKGAIVMIN
jgi:Rhs element Vgr protein